MVPQHPKGGQVLLVSGSGRFAPSFHSQARADAACAALPTAPGVAGGGPRALADATGVMGSGLR